MSTIIMREMNVIIIITEEAVEEIEIETETIITKRIKIIPKKMITRITKMFSTRKNRIVITLRLQN